MKYLKVKDTINLKELENFGFKAITMINGFKYQYIEMIGNYEVFNIKIDENRILHFNQLSKYNRIPSIIYDLIKADMTEVVEYE